MINNTYYYNDTMKIKHIITEAKGIFGRNAGDPFVHTDGRKANFQSVEAYPDPQMERFEDKESLADAIKQFEDNNHCKIEWVNQPSGASAFAVAILNDSDKLIYWGRYLQKTKANMLGVWDNKAIPQGWSLATTGATKLQAGYDPQHLIKTENEFMSTDQVVNTVKRNSPDDVQDIFAQNLQKLAQGRGDITFPGMANQMEAVRDYFGEIMQPLALAGGVIKGQAEDARKLLADGANWANCKMMWPMSMNAALCDSFLIAPNGQEIGISSKGGAGAKASAKNLYDAYKKAEQEGNTDLINSAKFTIDVVKLIGENTAKEGPFKIAEMLGMNNITPAISQEVAEYVKAGKTDFNDVSQASLDLLANFRVNNDVKGFNTGYAIMAAVAKTVAKEINLNPEFTTGALALLNQSSIIQVYTKMAKKGDDAVLSDFRAVYPPNFDGQIKVDGGKSYYSSRIQGKLAFAFS